MLNSIHPRRTRRCGDTCALAGIHIPMFGSRIPAILTGIFLSFIPCIFHAQSVRYVAPTGNDAGSCTLRTAPCRLISYAVGEAEDGDTIKVMVGTYLDAVVIEKTLTIEGDYGPGFIRNETLDPIRTVIDGGSANRPISIAMSPV